MRMEKLAAAAMVLLFIGSAAGMTLRTPDFNASDAPEPETIEDRIREKANLSEEDGNSAEKEIEEELNKTIDEMEERERQKPETQGFLTGLFHALF